MRSFLHNVVITHTGRIQLNVRGIAAVALLLIVASAGTGMAKENRGEALFREKCAGCHPDGDNTVNDKTLKRKDMVRANLKSGNDIVRFLRANSTAMPKYDKKELPDRDAREIAGYILRTFR